MRQHEQNREKKNTCVQSFIARKCLFYKTYWIPLNKMQCLQQKHTRLIKKEVTPSTVKNTLTWMTLF